MDDLTPHKKKKLSGIRRLGKFFGLGGSASKSETKSQIDDCEEFDSSSTNDNTIESIMALKPEERILPPILNPEPQLFIQTVTVSNSFKPKALPPSLNRIPGRSSTSPRGIENNLQNPSSTASSPRSLEEINSEISEIQSQQQLQQSQQNQPQTQDDSQQNQKPQQPPKPQRIEDIIRLKLPLARKSSRLLNTQKSTDSTPEVRVDTNEKKNIILEDDKSPVSNTFIDNYSPIVLNEQKNAQQNLLKSTSQDLIQSTNTRTSPISPKANESPSLKMLPANNDKIEDIKNINTRKDIDDNNNNSNDNDDNDNEDNFSKNLLIESININTIDSTDSYLDITHTLNDTESLRSNSIDNDGTRDRSGSTSLQKYSSRDSEDSLPITLNIDILKEPVAIKTKDDLRAEFLSFRLSSKSKIVSPESISDPVKSRSNELNESKISEENDEDNNNDDDSVSSYGSDEIDLLNTYSDDVEEQEEEEERKVKENLSSTTSSSIPSGSFYDLNITHMLRSESIPEGDENDDDGDDIDKKYNSKNNKKDNVDLTPIKITSVVTKRQSISHNESKQKSNQNKRLSMSSIPSDSNITSSKDDKKINKQILHAPIDKSSSLPMPIPPPQQANQTTKTSKQRSKSILSTPNNQSNINSGWNNSTKSITTTNNNTNNNLPGQKTTSSTLKSRRQSNNITINTSTSITSSSSSSSMTINSIAPFSNPTTPATTPTTLNLNGDIRQLQQSFSSVSNSSNTDYLSPRSATSISSNSSKPTTPTTPTTPSSNKSPNNFNSNISTNQLNHDPDSPDLKITTKRISSSNSTRLSTDNKRKSIAIGEKLNKF